ncbi:MAG: hypothetical protein EOP53_26820, partial [Sphingobacteriales bacterium]
MRFTKKNLAGFKSIRAGNIEQGIIQMQSINNEKYAAVSLAEIFAFQNKWEDYQSCFKIFFTEPSVAWYSFNIPSNPSVLSSSISFLTNYK